ncbi:succinate dehydrogenase, cytochrome b556 subunit [Sulfuricella denitrificans skB26]|uniref:Succinate dehydrogenase cytochrome b556 subunit n=2 Tax=Sulfuricella denitrificans TaxID=649841 RepID=S6B3V2_SULDS|nr:succinate dehydrogenase, cytochrome b556 subunit [Sulfuricella denitrificans skB26]
MYLNLFRIKLPLPGIVSFLHRVSGALLFIAIPLFLAALQLTLGSQADFDTVTQGFESPLVKLVLIALLWGYSHHFFAGLRFIAMDMGLGVELAKTRRNSWLVMASSLTLTAITGGWLLW